MKEILEFANTSWYHFFGVVLVITMICNLLNILLVNIFDNITTIITVLARGQPTIINNITNVEKEDGKKER